MKPNIGDRDQTFRMGVGLVLVALGSYFAMKVSIVPGVLMLLVGSLSVYEAAVRWCVIYALLGKNTCPARER